MIIVIFVTIFPACEWCSCWLGRQRWRWQSLIPNGRNLFPMLGHSRPRGMSCEDGAALRLVPRCPGGPYHPFRENVPGIHCSWILAGHTGHFNLKQKETINEVWLAVPIKLVVNVTQPGCVCREKCSCPFRSKKSGQRHPNIARSKIGKPELPLNVRTDSPFSPQTYTLKPRWTRHLLKETTL